MYHVINMTTGKERGYSPALQIHFLMALLLDEKLVDKVAEACPAEFLKYYDCLGKGDADQCLIEQRSLSACVRKKSPTFKKIIDRCQRQIDRYEECIKKNDEFRTQCFDILLQMRQCVSETLQ